MSVDKLVDSTQLDADLTSVANAIRTKGGTSASLAFPADFISAVNAISGGGEWTEKSGSFTAASDFNNNNSVATTYTGSILIATGLTDIKLIVVWNEAWADQTATRPCFGGFIWADSALLSIPVFSDNAATPYYYGAGFAMGGTTSNWYGSSGNAGPVLNCMTNSVPAGSFGIRTHSSTYQIKTGDVIKWKAWGT